MFEKLRYRLWSLLCKRPNVCPANAYSLVIWGLRQNPHIDSLCRLDCEQNGRCWCGKIDSGRR